MPQHRKPSNDAERLIALRKAATVGRKDQMDGTLWLTDDVVMMVEDMMYRFEANEAARNERVVARVKAVARAKKALAQLRGEVRMAWKRLTNYIRWEVLPDSYYTSFGLTKKGEVPKGNTREFWLQHATQVLKGMYKLIGDGYTFQYLSPDAVQHAHAEAQEAFVDVEYWKGQVQDVEAELRLLRQEADVVCRKVYTHLRYVLDGKTPSQTRAIMRRYGVNFDYSSGEEAMNTAEAPDMGDKSMDIETESKAGTTGETGTTEETVVGESSFAVVNDDSSVLHRNALLPAEPENGSTSENGTLMTK